jgi:hypothetical protein
MTATVAQKPITRTARVRPCMLGIVIADGLTSEIMLRILLTGTTGVRAFIPAAAGYPAYPAHHVR